MTVKGNLEMPRQLNPEPTPTLAAPQEPTFLSEFFMRLGGKVSAGPSYHMNQYMMLGEIGLKVQLLPGAFNRAVSTLRGGNLGPRGLTTPQSLCGPSWWVGEARRTNNHDAASLICSRTHRSTNSRLDSLPRTPNPGSDLPVSTWCLIAVALPI